MFQSLVQPKAYIVTQGPTESTMPDFWRMTWQEKASCIVMVTRTFDFIRVMCVQYWPAAKNRLILLFPVKILLFPIKIILFPVKIWLFPFEIIQFPVIREEVYGGVGVTVESEEQLANFMIRWDSNIFQWNNFAMLNFYKQNCKVLTAEHTEVWQ